MSTITIDSKDFSNTDELHKLLQDKLRLPEYYGKNLNALWDCLTAWIDLPMTIEWVGYDDSKHKIGDYAEKLLEAFRDAEQEVDGFTFVLKP